MNLLPTASSWLQNCGKNTRNVVRRTDVHDASCTQTCRALSIHKCTSRAHGTEVLLLIKETAKKKKSLMKVETMEIGKKMSKMRSCLLYTSDAADER